MKNIKIFIGILIGAIITYGLTSYAYKLNASLVTYDNKNTTLESNTVSGAIDELGVLATTSMSELKAKMDTIETKIDKINESSSNGEFGLNSNQTKQLQTIFNYVNRDDDWSYATGIVLRVYTHAGGTNLPVRAFKSMTVSYNYGGQNYYGYTISDKTLVQLTGDSGVFDISNYDFICIKNTSNTAGAHVDLIFE